MLFVWCGCGALLILCGVALLRKNDPNKVRLPKRFLVWPSGCCVLSLAMSFYAKATTIQIVCYSLLAIACISLLIYRNYRIIYDRESFTYRSIWGISHRYKYADIWGLEKKKRLYLQKNSMPLYKSASGLEAFLQIAHRRYQSTHQSKRIPKINSFPKGMGFSHGNIWGESDYIIVFAMLYAFIIGIFVFLLFSIGWDWGVFLLFCGAIALLTLFVMAAVYVARHADTLPRWLVFIFYRPSSLTFKKEK